MFCNQYYPPSTPMSLYKSTQGNYFVGGSQEKFGRNRYAWAGLFNPCDSGVLLFVNVFTVTNVTDIPFSYQVWLNAETAGTGIPADMLSSSNLAIYPLPKPRVQFLYAGNVSSQPLGGTPIYGRRCGAQTTVVSEEDGKFIIPPGGNFLVNCIPPENSGERIPGYIAFGWWEDPCV